MLKWYALLSALFRLVISLRCNYRIRLGYSGIIHLQLSLFTCELSCFAAENNGMIQWKITQEQHNGNTCPPLLLPDTNGREEAKII